MVDRYTAVSVMGNMGLVYAFARNISFLSGQAFNPIRDAQWFLFGMAAFSIYNTVTLFAYWPLVQNSFRSIRPTYETQDLYADNELSTLRICLLYTSPSPRDRQKSRMPSSA
eukprot:TRINITY_DN12727_c0_g2_i2.p1 TRINITY_DN12727_c0_g2~~TRINITY_DN12727_c0_g2_i2.p1  ORF type:complete len:112 (+),score=8.51 TRINITY_DN12727_c0_g2_i2:171-506(+)